MLHPRVVGMCGSSKYSFPPHGRSLEIPRGRGSHQPKFIRVSMNLNWKFQGEGRAQTKNLSWGRCGYYLEPHNGCLIFYVKATSELL